MTGVTGTVTTGAMSLVSVTAAPTTSEEEVRRLAAAVESGSEHPIARAIVEFVSAKVINQQESAAIQIFPQILGVLGPQVEIARLGKIRKWIRKQLFAVDIHDLIGRGIRMSGGHLPQQG